MRACGGTWIAHGSGTADRETVDRHDRIAVPPASPSYRLRRVWVSEEEQDGYYYGLANEGLWPLCHIAFVRPTFRESDWRYYEQINERFADAVAREAQTEDPIVLVQDYHFALAPRMIRDRLPKATIITFWHIPWPNAETFGICPWKEKILDGLLGSSIIGFHTQFHCNNFFETVDRFIESRIDRENAAVTLCGHETKIRPYPISIEWPPKALEHQPPVETCRAKVRERFGLAPTQRSPSASSGSTTPKASWIACGRSTCCSRTKPAMERTASPSCRLRRRRAASWPATARSRARRSRWPTRSTRATAMANYQPIRLLIRHHEPDEVFELFRAADMCIVSSLHDGMNLVAKEYRRLTR